MRITHVITRLIVGGAQENTVSSVLGLSQKPGFEVDLISGPTSGREGSLEHLFQNQTDCPLTLVPSLIRPVSPWHDLRALLRLEAIFKSTKPDLVHTHSGKAGFLGRLAAKRAGVPLVLHTIHGPSFGSFQGWPGNWMFRTAERMAGRCTDHFVTVAQAMTEMSLRAGIQKAGNYTRIFSGFDLDPFLAAKRDVAFRRELGFAPDDFVIGKLARLTRLKGHDDLLEAAPEILQRIPSARFLLIGDGNWWGRLRRKAADLGVAESVVFRGLIPPSAVPSHLAQCDVLVHLSRREGLPRSLPQAMSVGLPVVAYDCDGAREVCLERETGFLLPAGDVKGLGDRLVELADNPELCVRFGRSGRNLVRRNFSVELMVDQLAGLYERLWKERNGMSPAAR